MQGRRFRILIALLLCGAIYGFTQYQAASSGTSRTIEYILTWQTDSKTAVSTSGVWENDMDIVFTLDEAYIHSLRVELVECDPETAVLPFSLYPQTAHAGHGDEEISESRVAEPIVESILNAHTHSFGSTSAEGASYCEAHYLIAAASDSSANLPESLNFNGTTLHFSGQYQTANMETAVPFEVTSNLAWGVLLPLQDSDGQAVQTDMDSDLEIVIHRDMNALFDAIDPTSQSEQEIAMTLLRNIAEQTNFYINQ